MVPESAVSGERHVKTSALSEIKAELEPSCVLFWVSGLDIICVGSSRSWPITSAFCSFQAIKLCFLNVSVVLS